MRVGTQPNCRRTAVLLGLTFALTTSQAAVITYPNFNNTTGLTLNGSSATVNDSGRVIRLAPVGTNRTGSVWFNTRLDLIRGFSTTFTYNIHDGSGADGLAFVLHSDPRGLGTIGGGTEGNQLAASGITNSVAIAFRTFVYNRIEVDACGPNQPQKIGGSDTSSLNPPYCTIGSVYQTQKNSLRGVHTVTIDYVPGTLTIKLDGSTVLTTSINIADYVNTPDGKVYVGFTGGTGASTDNHDIRSWSFANLPNLSISKTHTGNFYQGQTNAQYRIVITNIGDTATVGAVVAQDDVPPSLTPVSATGTGWTCTTSGNFQCQRADPLAAGASYPAITLTVRVADDAPAQVSNIATVSGGGGLINNSAGDLAQIDGRPDLTIAKSHSGNFIQGQQGIYTLTVTNLGRGSTTNEVVVTDVVPTGLTPLSASGSGWNCPAISGQTITCRRATVLAAGASYPSINVVVVPAANAPASLTNTTTVNGGGDINLDNNSASDPTTILGPPDLTVVKSHSGNFTQGQTGALAATFTLSVSNVGGTATSGQVSLTDALPAALAPISATGTGWACSISGQTLSCNRSDTLASGGTYPPITLSVAIAPNAPASVINTVTISGGSELNTSNNSSTDTVTINPAPDLTINKTHTGTFIQGQSGTYNITVSNVSSAQTVGSIQVTDALPTGLTPTAASGTGWSCAITGQTINCSSEAVLTAGQSSTIIVTASVASNAPSTVTNPASVSGGGDVTPDNNSATDPTPIVNGPDLTISKTHSGGFIQGQTGTFTITVSNIGQSASVGVSAIVIDTLPVGLTPVSATGTGWACSVTTQVMECNRADTLNAGSSYPPITLTAGVSATASGNLTNSVSVSGGNEVNSGNNTANDTVTITPGPDLTISKSHVGNFNQGQQGATYTLTVSNSGPSPTTGTVAISDTVPSGLTLVSAAGTGWGCSLAGQNVSCTRADMLAGTSAYPPITLTVDVAVNAPASLTNTASVSGGGDVNPANNTATDVTIITPQPDLTISKSHAGNFFQGQQGATYSIVVTNSGAGASSGAVTVTDTVPAGLTPTAAVGAGWTCSLPSGQAVSCTRSDALAASTAYPHITLTVNVASNAPASVTNSVAVSGGGDVNPANNTANDPTTVGAGPDLTISKTHSGNFSQGQQGAIYSIVARNSGPAPTTGSIVVVDTLPAGLTPTAASGTGWNCVVTGQNVTCNRSDALAGNTDYAPITLTVNVAVNAPGSIVNPVTISGGGDVNESNNSANDPTTVTPQPDLTISKSHSGNFTQGQQGATYSLVVTNSGAGASNGAVTVTDTLPAGLTVVGAAGAGWTCAPPSGQTVSCSRSDVLASSGSYPLIAVTVNVANNAPASVINMVAVSGGGDVNPSNNTASDPTTIGAGPDLTVSKTHSGNFSQGQQGATYSIVARNSGPAPTTSAVTVVDAVPTGLTPTGAAGTGWTCNVAAQNVSCNRLDVLAGNADYAPIIVTVNVAFNAPASVTNPVTVSGGGDVDPNNNTANDPTTIAPQPDVTISKSHVSSFTQGQQGATYSIVVTNSGAAATSGAITVTDTVPIGLIPTGATGTGWTCVPPVGQNVTCNRSDALAANAAYPPITLAVNVANNAPASVTNMVAVSGGGDVNPSNNSASDPTTIGAGPDLTITKTHSGNFTQGQQAATYSVTVRNSGLAPTTGAVTVVDTVPAGLTPVAASGTGWTCGVAGQNVTCNRSDALAANSDYPPIALTVNVAFNAPASVTNTVTASGGGDVNSNNDTANDPTTITPQPDLTISKSHSSSFTQGQQGATYSIVVTNSGAGATSGTVTVTDTVPVGLTPTVAAGTGWTCAPPSGQTATCTRADAIAASIAYPPITLTVNVANNAAASLINEVAVSGGGDVNPNNNTATDPTTIGAGPDLTISKTHSGNFNQGQQGAAYAIVVRNSGLAPTTGAVNVVDTVPAALTPVAASGTGWTCSVAGQNVTCNRSDALAANSDYPPITLTVNVAVNAPASLTNTVTTSGGGDVNSSNDTANDPTTIVPQPDLTISKSHLGSFAQGQQGATYSIVVTNSGAGVTSGAINVTDTLPAGLIPVNAAGTGWTCATPNGQAVACNRSDALAPGSTYPPITLTVNVANNAPGSAINTVAVSGGGDSNPNNNTATDSTTIGAGPDLTISKSHTGNFSQGQQGATYSIVVRNSGLTATTGTITVVDTVPAGLTPVSATGPGWTCAAPNGQTVECNRSDILAPNTDYPAITLTVNVAVNAPSSVTNTATISGGGEVNPNNDTATDPTTITPHADLTITKSHSNNFFQGQQGATYAIIVSNAGSVASAGSVSVSDTLPTGLTPTAASGAGWTCTLAGQAVDCNRSDSLAAEAQYPPISIVANVSSTAPISLTNTATVSGGGDANPANNTAIDPTTISLGPDLTISKSHSGNFMQGQRGALYTLTIQNVGVQGTNGVINVVDTAPTGLTITGASGSGWTCNSAATTAACSRSDVLAAGATFPTISITVDVAPDAPASLINTVAISGGGDVVSTNNAATDTTTIGAAPDLTITKSHPGDLTQGQTGASFALIATNVGLTATSGPITVVDALPASLTPVSVSGPGWTCGINAQTATCNRSDSVGPGVSFPPITLVANAAVNAPGTLINVATISGGGDVNNNNNTATDNVTIGNGPDLSIIKTHVGTSFVTGQRDATYNLVVKNVGVAPTSGPVTVQDSVPAGLLLASAAGTGWACTTTGALASCSRSDALNGNDSYPPIILTVSVASDAAAQIVNIAMVSGGGDVIPSNNSSTDTVNVEHGPELTVTKTHVGNFTQGQTGAIYTITVKNQGGSPSRGEIFLVDQLPTGLNPAAINAPGWSCNLGSRGVGCTRSDVLAPGTSYPPITFTVDVAADAPNNVTNTVRVSGGGDVNPDGATASDPTVITGTPDLEITKIHVGDFIAGQQGTYLLTVLNQGSGPSNGLISVNDVVPDAMTPFSATGDGWDCSIVGQAVHCVRDDALDAGQSYPGITLIVNIALTSPRAVLNTATVAATGGQDSNTNNDIVTDTVVVTTPNFTLQIVKQADQQTVQVGDIVTYQVIVTNPSQLLIPTTDLTDTPPASFKYIKGTGLLDSGGNRKLVEPQVNGSSLVFSMGAIPPESTVTVSYRLRVAANAGLGVHVNSAIASGTLAPGLTEHSVTAFARVRVDPGVFTTSQFIIGRVFADSNQNGLFERGDQPIAGVRLFLSNGQSVVTDSEGLYSIPSVGEGAVVISLDPITLPRGYELLDTGFRSDDSWTRLLRTPLGSGGMLRQNFALTRKGGSSNVTSTSGAEAPPALLESSARQGGAVDRLEIESDRKELTADGRDSTLIHVKAFDANNQPAADGRVLIHVSSGRLLGVETCDPGSTYNPCAPGTGQALADPSRPFNGPSASAATTSSSGTGQIIPMSPQGIANFGQTLIGAGAEPVGGVAAEQVSQNTQQQAVLLRNGEAQIRLISEATTGKSQILATSGDAESQSEVVFVSQQRSTVLVGLAQLSVGKASPEAVLFRNNDTVHEYAKFFFQSPLFNEKNLLTVAYDSNRPINRTSPQDRLFQLNPLENVYPLFGDSSTRYQVAQSNSHLFVRLDRGLSSLMFGDLRGATSTSFRPNDSFTAYQRNLTGVQLHLEDKAGSYLNAKGARPETAFVRDILSGDVYLFAHLTHQNLLAGSETIVLETRDRRNPEIVLNRETLTRSTDYNIDWSIGSIYFLRRLNALDSSLNLIQIVVTYEYIVQGTLASVYDVTGEKRFSQLGMRLGGSFVSQNQGGFGDFYLGGIHGQKDTWNKGVFRFEGATSQGKFGSGAGTFNDNLPLNTSNLDEHNGFAYRASWEQPLGFASSALELKAFKTDDGFLNPFGPTTVPGARQESATFKARPLEGGDLAVGFLNERNRSFGYNNQRRTASALWNQSLIAHLKLTLGYNFRSYDDNQSGQQIDSNLFIAGLNWQPVDKLKVGVRREQNVTKADPTYPNTTLLSASYAINDTSRLYFTQRLSTAPIVPISNVARTGLGALASKNETSVGVETRWSQYTSFTSRYQIENGINGTDSYAVIGLANRLPLNKILTVDSNYERALHIAGGNTSYNSFSLGLSWLPSKTFRASSRYQLRDQRGFGGTFVVGAAGRISEAATMLARYQLSRDAFLNSNNVGFNGTVALAVRPLKSDRIGWLLNYTVQSFQSSGMGLSPATPDGIATLPFQGGNFYQPASPVFGPQNQLVQILSSDGFWQMTRRLELFGRVATSFRESSLPGDPKISTLTYLTQGRIQYRFAKYFDAATELKWMAQPVTDTRQYTTGTEVGLWALRDLRVGLGYNFRSNINYGVDFGDPTIHRGFYFTMTSKMSKLFDLFGTPREGI